MNVYAIGILAALVATFVLRVVVALLDLGHGPDEPPAELADVIDANEYRRSRRYKRARTRFSLVHSGFDLAILVAFWLAGGFGVLDAWLRQFDLGRVGTGLAFIGVLFLVLGLCLRNVSQGDRLTSPRAPAPAAPGTS